jgi:hypothetical protein
MRLRRARDISNDLLQIKGAPSAAPPARLRGADAVLAGPISRQAPPAQHEINTGRGDGVSRSADR